MKKIKFFSFASAVLLASAAGMTSCSSDSIEPTGGSGVAGQVVKTQFVINIPYAGNESGGNARVSTRMTAENTQNDNNFLGLKDIEMFAFDNVPGETSQTSTRTIRIRTDMPSTSNDYRRIYSDIAIPVGTKNMILYARASKIISNPTGSTTKDEFQAGSLTDLYRKLNQEYFGEEVKMDELVGWSCYYVPHFYYDYYVYKYTLGMTVALAIVKRILNGDTQQVERYLNFLKSGGKESPVDLLSHAGVDPLDDAIYDDAFHYFEDLLNEFEKLVK